MKIQTTYHATLPIIAISFVIISLVCISSSLFLQKTLAQQQLSNQTGSLAATNAPDLARMLVKDAMQSLQNGDTPGALNHLTLADQQLSTANTNGLVMTLVKDAMQSLQNGDTPGALNHLTLADQQLSTGSSTPKKDQTSGEFNPQVVGKPTQSTMPRSNTTHSSASPAADNSPIPLDR
jgi:hypothetical protein